MTMCDALSLTPKSLQILLLDICDFRKFRDLLVIHCLHIIHELGQIYKMKMRQRHEPEQQLVFHAKYSKPIMDNLLPYLENN
jgi:hypothetical protein